MKVLNQFNQNVVKLLDVVQTNNNTYIVSEFCNGGDLKDYITKKGKLPESEAIEIIRDVLKGFKELFKHNLIHRDIKPANILIHDNIFKLTDFGFAKTILENQLMQSLVGTPLYMSP